MHKWYDFLWLYSCICEKLHFLSKRDKRISFSYIIRQRVITAERRMLYFCFLEKGGDRREGCRAHKHLFLVAKGS